MRWTILKIYVAILFGIKFIDLYSVINALLYNINYRRMNNSKNMDKKAIKINLLMHGFIALIMVGVTIYLSYFKYLWKIIIKSGKRVWFWIKEQAYNYQFAYNILFPKIFQFQHFTHNVINNVSIYMTILIAILTWIDKRFNELPSSSYWNPQPLRLWNFRF